MKTGFLVGVLSTALASTAVAADQGSCKSQAQTFAPSDASKTLALVREWDETVGSYQKIDDEWRWVVTGGWKDGGDNHTPADLQFGCYWLRLELDWGKNYTISIPDGSGCFIQVKKAESSTYTAFSGKKVGTVSYYYIKSGDWAPFDPAKVSYYVYINGGKGSVGKTATLTFQQKSIDEIAPSFPGSIKSPRSLDVTESGSRKIDSAPERCEEMGNRWATAYCAQLHGGFTYTFAGVVPAGQDGHVYCSATDYPGIPGDYVFDRQTGNLTVKPRKDYSLVFVTIPDDDHYLNGNVSGGTLSWTVVDPSKPVWTGLFHGVLTDVDRGQTEVEMAVEASVMPDGATNFVATLVSGSVLYSYEDKGSGRLVGSAMIGGKTYTSVFSVQMVDESRVSVAGSAYLDVGGATELSFEGFLYDGVWIVFEKNGGTGTMEKQKCLWGQVYNLNPCTFTPPEGKRLVGWQSVSGPVRKRYDPGILIFNLIGDRDGVVTMRAIWGD